MSSDAYVNYDFVYVKCNNCDGESTSFDYKDHLTADESIDLLIKMTGFSIDKVNGGLICPECVENKLENVI